MQHDVFNPHAEFGIFWRRLPHWEQPGAYHFITYRTADAMPAATLRAWQAERNRILRAQGIDTSQPDWESSWRKLPAADRGRLRARWGHAWQAYLDAGLGACPLRRPDARRIVVENLRHLDGQRYVLDTFVVMPNHVHILAGLHQPGSLLRQCQAWKRYTATRINRLLGSSGRFWQRESWDHIVRSADEFERVRSYIAENPQRAGLDAAEYTLFVRAGSPS